MKSRFYETETKLMKSQWKSKNQREYVAPDFVCCGRIETNTEEVKQNKDQSSNITFLRAMHRNLISSAKKTNV